MSAIVDLDQPLDGDRRISGWSRGSRVQQLLDVAQICAHVEEMCGVAVTQPMGMHVIGDVGAPRARDQHAAHLAISHPRRSRRSAAQADEERLRQHAGPASQIEPNTQRVACGGRQRNDAFLAALAANPHVTAHEIEIAHVEADQLADAQTAAVEQLDERALARRQRWSRTLLRATPSSHGSLSCAAPRGPAARTSASQSSIESGFAGAGCFGPGNVALVVHAHLFAHQPAEETVQRGLRPSVAGRRVPCMSARNARTRTLVMLAGDALPAAKAASWETSER